MVHHRQDDDGNQNVEEYVERASPVAEETGHLLLVGRTGAAGAAGDPAAAVQKDGEHRDAESEEVEVPQFFDVVGIEKTFARDPVGHDGGDLLRPREFDETEDDEGDEQRIEEQSLQRVGDDDAQIAADADDRNGHDEAQADETAEGVARYAAHGEVLGQIEEVDEKARGHGGHDHVGQHLRNAAQCRGEDAEGAAVAHFEELAEAQGLRFAVAVAEKAREPHDDRDGHKDAAPEGEGESGLVVYFHIGHDADDRKSLGHARHADDVSAAQPSRREKVDHAPDVPAAVKGHEVDECQRKKHDEVVDPCHHDAENPLLNPILTKCNLLKIAAFSRSVNAGARFFRRKTSGGAEGQTFPHRLCFPGRGLTFSAVPRGV